MCEAKDQTISRPDLATTALLLCGEQATTEDRNITRVLDLFGIPWKTVTASDSGVDQYDGSYSIVSSADCLASVIQPAAALEVPLPCWVMAASSVYVYGFRDTDQCTKLLRLLTENTQAKVRSINIPETTATITEDFPEMCGPMSGMKVPITLRSPGYVCDLEPGGKIFRSVVRISGGDVFFGSTWAGVRFYLNVWGRTLDVGTLSPQYFDVKKYFCEAVPLVFYLKWAFQGFGSGRRETNACLIVDDPPLKRRYGFLNFREALDLMDRHNFSTTIAFIPWNWRRTDPGTLSLFRDRPERLSLVVHGCDHTASEFAERCPALLNRKIQTALQRMERFRQRASCGADRVMVFPQGEFSAEAGRALKLNGFVAAVNTEVAPAQHAENETTIADLWSVAIMRYGTFPIFTRRYANHGIENFAFDALLGKPCLIASHHEVFKDHALKLVDFVERLNSLEWTLAWRPLGEVVRRSVAVRRLEDGRNLLRMFASSAVIENRDGGPNPTFVLKEEGDLDCVEAVWVNGRPVEFTAEDRYLRVWLAPLRPERTAVRVLYQHGLEAIASVDSGKTRITVAAKRYLSEFRDNYLARSEFLYRSATRIKRRLVS
jgi:hypothetical protein